MLISFHDYYARAYVKCDRVQALALVRAATQLYLRVEVSVGADALLAQISREQAMTLISKVKSKRATLYVQSWVPRGDRIVAIGRGRRVANPDEP